MFVFILASSSVLRSCSGSHIPTAIPPKSERRPLPSARAARDAAVPTRKGRNQRLTGRERHGGEGGVSPWQLCVFVSARESDKQWLTVRRKHTHTHSHIHAHTPTHSKRSQIRTATPRSTERESVRAGKRKERATSSRLGTNTETNKGKRYKQEKWKAQRDGDGTGEWMDRSGGKRRIQRARVRVHTFSQEHPSHGWG